MTHYRQMENQFGLDVYPKRDLVILSGENAIVRDHMDKCYIDCVGGHGAASLGHGNRAIVRAVSLQARILISCPGIFYNDQRSLLMSRLHEITPPHLTKTFLCNSGAESLEAAIKFARISTGKSEFICAIRGFHGRTMGALSATFSPKYKKEFEPLVPGFSHAPFNNIEKLFERITPDTAAIILEVIQGEGGVHVGEQKYFSEVQKICRRKGILLIIDEVQTGFGRTGRMFAIEHFEIKPDILCLAKAMAGGLPMGAVICSDRVNVPMGKHGTTFGGNPLVCSAALATIDTLVQKNLPAAAEKKGNLFKDYLIKKQNPKIKEIRGLGLMIGIQLTEKVKPYILALMREGVLALPAGPTVLRLLPPLTISNTQLKTVADKIHQVLSL